MISGGRSSATWNGPASLARRPWRWSVTRRRACTAATPSSRRHAERGGHEAPDVLRQQQEALAYLRGAVSAGSHTPWLAGVTRIVQVRGKSAGRRVWPAPHRCLELQQDSENHGGQGRD